MSHKILVIDYEPKFITVSQNSAFDDSIKIEYEKSEVA